MKPLAWLVAPAVPFAATAIPDANLVLNLLMLIVLMFGAPRFFKSKNAEAALAEKDITIATHEQSIASARIRIEGLQADIEDLRGSYEQLRERNAEYQRIAAGFQARYEEQGKYTAKEALGALEQMLALQADENKRRHAEVMAAMESIAKLVGDRRARRSSTTG